MRRDPCAPPKESIEVVCLHCWGVFQSKDMTRSKGNKYRRAFEPIWWCPNERCDGAGIGFDLYPTSEPFGASIKAQAASREERERAAARCDPRQTSLLP